MLPVQSKVWGHGQDPTKVILGTMCHGAKIGPLHVTTKFVHGEDIHEKNILLDFMYGGDVGGSFWRAEFSCRGGNVGGPNVGLV